MPEARLLDPSRDAALMAGYLPELLDHAANEALRARRARLNEMRRAVAMNPGRLERLEQQPRIPYAVERWFEHLAYVDLLASVCTLAPADLTGEELRGLALFRAARDRYWSEHERCACGAVNIRGAQICAGGCGRSTERQRG